MHFAKKKTHKAQIRQQNLEMERERQRKQSASSGSQQIPMEVDNPVAQDDLMNVAETAGAKRPAEEVNEQIKKANLGQDVIMDFPFIMAHRDIGPKAVKQQLIYHGFGSEFKESDKNLN